MPDGPVHPLLEILEPSGKVDGLLVGVERIEKREIRGSSMWTGSYLAFFIARGRGTEECFPASDHIDIGWAVGDMVYRWCMRNEIPTDTVHLTDTLFAVEDVLLEQELKCWFHAEMVDGQCRARPIITAFDASSPGEYFSVNDFLMTQPQYRKIPELWLRLRAVLIPAHRCPRPTRELTMRADDGQELRYRVDASGRRETTAGTSGRGDRPSLDEIIDLANQQRKRDETSDA